jgi:hypothetical protein
MPADPPCPSHPPHCPPWKAPRIHRDPALAPPASTHASAPLRPKSRIRINGRSARPRPYATSSSSSPPHCAATSSSTAVNGPARPRPCAPKSRIRINGRSAHPRTYATTSSSSPPHCAATSSSSTVNGPARPRPCAPKSRIRINGRSARTCPYATTSSSSPPHCVAYPHRTPPPRPFPHRGSRPYADGSRHAILGCPHGRPRPRHPCPHPRDPFHWH